MTDVNQPLSFTDVDCITSAELIQFLKNGLCYVKLPTHILQHLLNIQQQALSFFHLVEDEKK